MFITFFIVAMAVTRKRPSEVNLIAIRRLSAVFFTEADRLLSRFAGVIEPSTGGKMAVGDRGDVCALVLVRRGVKSCGAVIVEARGSFLRTIFFLALRLRAVLEYWFC